MFTSSFIALLVSALVVSAADHGSTYGGSGPYKSYFFEESTLINHTLYQPLRSAFGNDRLKIPVIVWGSGACAPMGLKFRGLLGEVASHGALLIATGPASIDPETYVDDGDVTTSQHPEHLAEAVDWVMANAGKGLYRHIDSSRIAVWGQSCGGLEAYGIAQDKRIQHVGIFNSGQLDNATSAAIAGAIKKPIFYFLGGPTDVAYPNGERDYHDLPKTTPAFLGNHDMGHSAGFDVLNAGKPGIAATNLMKWLLRGDTSSKAWFTNNGWKASGFVDATFQNLDKIKTSPI